VPFLLLHVDMDAFFASVEVRSDPRLTGKPLVVGGGPGGRGVATTASYAARKYGVRSGMALAEALRLCPGLLVIPVDGPKYIHASLDDLAALDRLSPRVEPASIDEAYVDLPGAPAEQWERHARRWGKLVRRDVFHATGLPCSVGAGLNKLQAKMATPLAKPFGVSVVAPGSFLQVFGRKPVSVVPGIGPRTTEVLAGMGITTVGELAQTDPLSLRARFGEWAELLRDQARGRDARMVIAAGEEPDPKSAGHETTFARDVADPRMLRATLWFLADRVSRRLRRGGFAARTVVVRFKVGKRRYSRQSALQRPIDEPGQLARTAWSLLEGSREGRALRLLGIAGSRLAAVSQEEPLFLRDRKRNKIIQAGDRLRDRFGEKTILPATVFLGEASSS
jgi:nucleotidyltransferase/DNA polymerase involved in DNA repair